MQTLKYKSFIRSAEIDVDAGIYFGRILFINDLISYQSDKQFELPSEFEAAVRTALIDGVANLTPAQIRNAFFPELTGAEFPVAINSAQVG